MREKTIRIRAKHGLTIPLPSSVVVDSPTTLLTHDNVIEVVLDRYTRRRLAAGDFVRVKDTEERVKQAWDAMPTEDTEPARRAPKAKE